MYRREYVRKRKRRRIVAIIGAASSVVVLSFAIIAFLGRFVGTFTVSLESRNVELTLLEKKDSSQFSSFLRVDTVVPFQEYTFKYFERDLGDDIDSVIDSDQTNSDLGKNLDDKSLNFFKYTYFIKNYGHRPAMYDWSVNILEDVASRDGRSLLDTLRVMVYVDGVRTIYGKSLSIPHYPEDDEHHEHPDYRAPVSADKDDPEFFAGYAENITSSKVVTAFRGQDIDVGQTKRYTIVAWLEGFRSSNEDFAPRGATIKLGVEINAYEIQ